MRLLMLLTVAMQLLSCVTDDAAQHDYDEALQWQEKGDAPRALNCLRRAATSAVSDSLRVSVYDCMGHLLFDEGMEEQALEAFLMAYEINQRTGDSIGMAYHLCDIANVYRTRESDDSCLYFFHEAIQLAHHQGNSQLAIEIGSQIAGYHLWHQQYGEARNWLMPALAMNDDDNGLCFMAAELYRYTGQADSARYYCNLLLKNGDTGQRQMAHRWLGEMLLDEGNTAKAAMHLKQYELLTDTLMQEIDTEALRRVNALYDYTQSEQENARLQQHIVVAVASVLVMSCMLVTLMIIFIHRRMEYRLKVRQLERLLDERQRREAATVERQQQILSDTPIYHRINRLLGDSRQPPMNDDDWHILEDTIEKIYPGFHKRLQSFKNLSTQELHISWLIKAGVSPIGIAQLTSRSKQTISSSRARLYKKVFGKNGSPAGWDEFILSL